jgi:hypothetical protein
VKNPGFEAAEPPPWTLIVDAPAAASLTIDSTIAYEGSRSARIDIGAAADARTAISLRQGGIAIGQGRRYVCRLVVRAETEREVRIRVVSASGATYGTRLFTADPTWALIEFEFGAFVDDPTALIEIDLGRSVATTWIDAVRITDASRLVP